MRVARVRRAPRRVCWRCPWYRGGATAVSQAARGAPPWYHGLGPTAYCLCWCHRCHRAQASRLSCGRRRFGGGRCWTRRCRCSRRRCVCAGAWITGAATASSCWHWWRQCGAAGGSRGRGCGKRLPCCVRGLDGNARAATRGPSLVRGSPSQSGPGRCSRSC